MVVQSDDLGIDIQHFHRPEAWTLGISGKVVVMATILLRKLWHLPKELRRFSFCIVARSKVLTSIYSGKQLHCWKPVGVGKKNSHLLMDGFKFSIFNLGKLHFTCWQNKLILPPRLLPDQNSKREAATQCLIFVSGQRTSFTCWSLWGTCLRRLENLSVLESC